MASKKKQTPSPLLDQTPKPLHDQTSSPLFNQTPEPTSNKVNKVKNISKDLANLVDPEYRLFQAKLIPNVDPQLILGIRIPALRIYAKRLVKEHPDTARDFLENPKHTYYDEMNLHGLLIGLLATDIYEAFDMLDAFLPHVDNWATCDLIRVKAFKQNPKTTLSKLKKWIRADGPQSEYVVRFGIVQLMEGFLDEYFRPKQLGLVIQIQRPEHYINMARAWYFSEALVKQTAATLPIFEANPPLLDTWTHNKSLQKARESYRVSPEFKEHLQNLKVSHKKRKRS